MSVFFGWDFTSKMLDRYCNRDAVSFKLIEKKFEDTERETLEKEIIQLKEDMKKQQGLTERALNMLEAIKKKHPKIYLK